MGDVMTVALAVPHVVPDWQTNLAAIEEMSAEAAQAGAQLIVFSEAAITGFISSGNPVADLARGQSVPGPASTALARIAAQQRLWLAAGLFERDGKRLYDSALLFAPDGTLRLHYRRIDKHWHPWFNRPAGSGPYAQGTQLGSAQTPFGSCSLLLCGDLFNAECRTRLLRLQPRWLLLPMARGFDEDVADAAQWYAKERYFYTREAQRAGVGLLMVNQLATLGPHVYFGGAMAMSKDGTLLAEHPLEKAGFLLVELEIP